MSGAATLFSFRQNRDDSTAVLSVWHVVHRSKWGFSIANMMAALSPSFFIILIVI